MAEMEKRTEKKPETAPKKQGAAPKKPETAPKKQGTAQKKPEPAPKKQGAAQKQQEAARKKQEAAQKKQAADKARAEKGKKATAGAKGPDADRTKNSRTRERGTPKDVLMVDCAERRGGFFAAIGNGLYTLGYAFEYHLLQVWRVVRDVGRFLGQLLAFLGIALGRMLARTAGNVRRDLAAPFVRFKRRRQQLRRVRARAKEREDVELRTFRGVGLKSSFQLLANIVGVVMPVAAAAALLFTAYNIVNMKYALAVEVNGQVLGYVADRSVVESAKGLLRDRIKLAGNQEMADWELAPTYTIARAPAYTTTHQLVNEILLNSENPTDLVQATGIYLDGELFAVTTDGERLQAYLEQRLDEYRVAAPEGATVSFVRAVECEPDSDDVFFSSSVESFDELIARLDSNVSEEVWVTATGEETLGEIAQLHGLTLETLYARNPQLAELDEDDEPDAGTELLVQRAEPFLQVQMTFRQQSQETLEHEVVIVETDERAKGARVTVQKGSDGLQEVWDDYVYIDGELVARQRVDELTVVLTEPVEEIVEVGTKEMDALPGAPDGVSTGGGGFMFPVPGSNYSSRGYRPGAHRGLDINAPGGTPIYAASAGTVVTAGWHYSWGYHVVIDHGNGMTSLYAHCSALYVSAGQQVVQGTPIGAVGSTGNSSGNHCHLEIEVNGQLVDPTIYVGYPY